MVEKPVEKRSVLLFGATGLVGSQCLRLLQEDSSVARIMALTRRALPEDALDEKTENRLIDFDRMEYFAEHFTAHQIFICLGTTLQAAGSKERFKQVDFTYCAQAAQIASRRKVKDLLLVSALGAKTGSMFFYSRVKGRLEEAVSRLPFRSVTIMRPSLLLGERKESRPGEARLALFLKVFGFLFLGPLRKYKPTRAYDVAAVMVKRAREVTPGLTVLASHEITEEAGRLGA